MTINSILEEIINLAKKYSASTVILFGSRAKGTATERSESFKNSLASLSEATH